MIAIYKVGFGTRVHYDDVEKGDNDEDTIPPAIWRAITLSVNVLAIPEGLYTVGRRLYDILGRQSLQMPEQTYGFEMTSKTNVSRVICCVHVHIVEWGIYSSAGYSPRVSGAPANLDFHE